MMKCLIIDNVHESLFSMLADIGWEPVYKPTLAREQVKHELKHADALIVRSKTRIDRDLLGDSPTIKFVGRAGAGLDNLELDFLASKNIKVVHAAEGNRDAVAEHTVGLLLSLLRHIPRADWQVRNSIWLREENRGGEIMGKTVAIIGYGNMGRAFARRLTGFGCKVVAFDKYKIGFGDGNCVEASMDYIFAEADIVSFHIPLTQETRHLIDRAYLNRFSKNIFLLNTSRGEIVRQPDLLEALEIGKVLGAGLDVLENEMIHKLSVEEQLVFNKLVKQSNVIFSPHIAGWTHESHIKINIALVEKIRALKLKP
jgi:D-3-phosphoglycerate dehydrogenase / 2-oxoglutarate reductase